MMPDSRATAAAFPTAPRAGFRTLNPLFSPTHFHEDPHFIVLTTICLSWSSVGAEEYKYPYHDPYLATITTVILNAEPVGKIKPALTCTVSSAFH